MGDGGRPQGRANTGDGHTTVVHRRTERLARVAPALGLAVATAVGTFAAIAAGIYLPGSGPPSFGQLLWTGVASAITGTLAFLQARETEERKRSAAAHRGGEHAADHGAPRSQQPAVFQLPRDIGDFTGREDVLGELHELLLSSSRSSSTAPVVVAIAGQPGVGKTALAVHAAHELRRHFPDAQLYVNLRGAEAAQLDPADALAELLRLLDVAPATLPDSLEERMRLYRARLDGWQALILLDNAASEAQVRPLLPGSPGCAVVITSRSRLSALEGVRHISLAPLGSAQAIDLLGKIIGQDRIDAEPAAAGEIVRLCGHLPLAVRIAGGRLISRPHWELEQYRQRLSDERHRLTELSAGDREVRASFDLSYRVRSPVEQRLFRRLGLLDVTDFGGWVAAPLLEVDATTAEDVLLGLVDAQLVEALRRADGPARYRFHDLLRIYSRERLEREEERSSVHAARTRLLDAYLVYGHSANAQVERWALDTDPPGAPVGPLWFDRRTAEIIEHDPAGWLARERAGLVAAVRQAHAAGSWQQAWKLAGTLPTILEWQALWGDWESTLHLSLEAARQTGDLRQQAITLERLARFHWDHDDWTEAARYLDECLTVLGTLGDPLLEAVAYRTLGELHRDQSRWDEAVSHYERSLRYFRARGLTHWTARTVGNLGDVYRDQGLWSKALACYQECLPLFRELGDDRSVAIILRAAADVYRDQGRPEDAIAPYDEALAVFRGLGDVRWQAFTLRSQAVAHRLLGQWEAAIERSEEALAIFRQVADSRGEAITLRILGDIYARRGRPSDAIRCYEQCMAMLERLGDERATAITRRSLGDVWRALGRWPEATAEYGASLTIARELADRREEALTLVRLAELQQDQECWAAAQESYDQCLSILRGLGDDEWEAEVTAARQELAGSIERSAADGDQPPSKPR